MLSFLILDLIRNLKLCIQFQKLIHGDIVLLLTG